MKPTIGRIVHYHPPVARSEGSSEADDPLPLLTYAALVVDDRCGDWPVLQVFPPHGMNYLVDCAPGGHHPGGVERTDAPTMGCWNWPPRE
jgi:hypothetical protein